MTGPWPRGQRRCVHSQAAASDESRRLRFAGEVRSAWASAARTGSVSSPAHRAKASWPSRLTARPRQAGGRDRGGPTLAPETSSGVRPESEAPGTRVGPCVTWARQLVRLCRGPGRSARRSGTSPCPSLGGRGGGSDEARRLKKPPSSPHGLGRTPGLVSSGHCPRRPHGSFSKRRERFSEMWKPSGRGSQRVRGLLEVWILWPLPLPSAGNRPQGQGQRFGCWPEGGLCSGPPTDSGQIPTCKSKPLFTSKVLGRRPEAWPARSGRGASLLLTHRCDHSGQNQPRPQDSQPKPPIFKNLKVL